MSLIVSILLIFATALALVSADRAAMKLVPAVEGKETEDSISSYFTKVLGFLWRADGSGYQHVWPVMLPFSL